MTRVGQLEQTIVSLTVEEYRELPAWFLERDWGLWDERVAAYAAEGRLGFRVAEAAQEKAEGTLGPL